MATLLLGALGTSLGGAFGGSVLGLSGAALGGMAGSFIGGLVDQALIAVLTPAQQIEGARLSETNFMGASEGATIGRLYGRARVNGQVIWCTKFTETVTEDTETVGGKGVGQKVTTTTYTYSVSLAIAFGEGHSKVQLGRIWMDSKEVDISTATWRFYPGSEDQAPDALIQAIEGIGKTPAFRGITYLVFEDLDLTPYGNRIPQITAEIIKPLASNATDELSGLLKSVVIAPTAGEFGYGTQEYVQQAGAISDEVSGHLGLEPESSTSNNPAVSLNIHNALQKPDFIKSMEQLGLFQDDLDTVVLTVPWFGDNLNLGACALKPRVEYTSRGAIVTPTDWSVNGLTRSQVPQVPYTSADQPVFGGTPSDQTVTEAITWLKDNGYRVVFCPTILLDITASNTLANPYSDNAATLGQPAYPSRALLTCSPAIGYQGSVDMTSGVTTQLSAFFTGTWGFRRMVLHYATLCAGAGGVDAFIFGSGLPGVTQARSAYNTFPGITHLNTLAADVRAIVGSGTKLGYAATHFEYHSYKPINGFMDLLFPLDNLWANSEVDFVGLNNYLPISDWRNGVIQADYNTALAITSPHSLVYLQSNIEGGEYYDWEYQSPADRASQTRTSIADPAYSKPWVFKPKDIRNWWLNSHTPRALGVEGHAILSGDVATNFFVQAGTETPQYTTDEFGGSVVRVQLSNNTSSWYRKAGVSVVAGGTYRLIVRMKTTNGDPQTTYLNINDGVNHRVQVNVTADYEVYVSSPVTVTSSSVDVYPSDPRGGSGSSSCDLLIAQAILVRVDSATTLWVPESKPIWFTEFGCPAVDKGTNQPDAVYDPKSSAPQLPYFSSGDPDAYIQRRYFEAVLQYWRDNSPTSGVYAGSMISLENMFGTFWDARPFPEFPGITNAWADYPLWATGLWLNGRLDAVALPSLVEDLCSSVGVTQISTSQLHGPNSLVYGFNVSGIMSVRDMLALLMSAYAFDAFESEGLIKFVLRASTVIGSIPLDSYVSTASNKTGFSVTRTQDTELPSAVKISYIDRNDDYRVASLDGKRNIGFSQNVASLDLPLALDAQYVRALADSIIHQAWMAREQGSIALPPSLFYFDPGDGFEFTIGSRTSVGRFQQINTAEFRQADFQTFDPSVFQLPDYPAAPMSMRVNSAPGYGLMVPMDIPLLTGSEPRLWAPRAATWMSPWPGAISVFKSDGLGGWTLLRTLSNRSSIGRLVAPLSRGPVGVWDRTNTITIEMLRGSLGTKTEDQVLNGSNALAVQTEEGRWEVLQFATAELIGPKTYTCSMLLRGQLGTDSAMPDSIPAGAYVVLLGSEMAIDPSVSTYLPITPNERNTPILLRWGNAYKSVEDNTAYLEQSYTFESEALKPYAPVHLRGLWDPNYHDIELSWVRQTRFSGDNWDVENIPLNEERELYTLQILVGSNVVREVTNLASASYTYTAAQQLADFGAYQSSVVFQVCQVSAEVGNGIFRQAEVFK